MSTAADTNIAAPRASWFTRSEAWLDEKGKGAWIGAMVLGFIFFWPVGLALLAYMIWSKRMFANSCGAKRHHHRHRNHHVHMEMRMAARHGFRPTGNTAFDAYKADTLQRLMDEQAQFEAFLERLRDAKDKSEFDQFMDERAQDVRAAADTDEDTADEAEDGVIIAEEPISKG